MKVEWSQSITCGALKVADLDQTVFIGAEWLITKMLLSKRSLMPGEGL